MEASERHIWGQKFLGTPKFNHIGKSVPLFPWWHCTQWALAPDLPLYILLPKWKHTQVLGISGIQIERGSWILILWGADLRYPPISLSPTPDCPYSSKINKRPKSGLSWLQGWVGGEIQPDSDQGSAASAHGRSLSATVLEGAQFSDSHKDPACASHCAGGRGAFECRARIWPKLFSGVEIINQCFLTTSLALADLLPQAS